MQPFLYFSKEEILPRVLKLNSNNKANQIALELDGLEGLLLKQITPAKLMLVSASLLGICLILVFLYFFYSELDENKKQSFIIFISALVAVSGFLLNASIKLHSEMRDRAFQLIISSRENPVYRNAFRYGMKFLRKEASKREFKSEKVVALVDGKDGDVELKFIERNADGSGKVITRPISNEEMRGYVSTIGNFFEEMAIAIEYKEVYEPLLLDYYHSILIPYYDLMKPKILPAMRGIKYSSINKGKDDRKSIFENIEWLYKRWIEYHIAITKMTQHEKTQQTNIADEPSEKIDIDTEKYPELAEKFKKETLRYDKQVKKWWS